MRQVNLNYCLGLTRVHHRRTELVKISVTLCSSGTPTYLPAHLTMHNSLPKHLNYCYTPNWTNKPKNWNNKQRHQRKAGQPSNARTWPAKCNPSFPIGTNSSSIPAAQWSNTHTQASKPNSARNSIPFFMQYWWTKLTMKTASVSPGRTTSTKERKRMSFCD